MPARKLMPLLIPDVVVKIEQHEPSPAPSDVSTNSVNAGKRKATVEQFPEMDREKKRKLMNRVAAQQSRDRKRQYLEQIEEEVKKLREENEALKAEKDRILREKERLRLENELIKTQAVVKFEEERVSCENDIPASFESAALINGPLQQGQVCRNRLLQTLLILLVQFLQANNVHVSADQMPNLTTSLTSSANSAETAPLSAEQIVRFRQMISRCAQIANRQQHWGPHQHAWNPSQNSSCSPPSLIPLS